MKALQSFCLGTVSIDWKDDGGGQDPVAGPNSFEILGQANTELVGVFAHGDELWAVTTRGEPPEPLQNTVMRVSIFPGPSSYAQYELDDPNSADGRPCVKVYYAGTVMFERRTCPQIPSEPVRVPGRVAGYLAIGHVMVEDFRGRGRAGDTAFRFGDPKDRPRRMITL